MTSIEKNMMWLLWTDVEEPKVGGGVVEGMMGSFTRGLRKYNLQTSHYNRKVVVGNVGALKG